MQLKTLLIVNAVLALVSGIACAAMPALMLANYGVSLSPMGNVVYQFWGAALIGLGLLAWLIRNIRERGLQRRLALALFITNGLNLVMSVRGQYAGANSFGWSTVALFFLLTIGYLYFMVARGRGAVVDGEAA